MPKHTPEPWQNDDGEIFAQEGTIEGKPYFRVICKCENWQTNPDEVLDEMDKANMRRLCAAVNATVGIPTEELEAVVIGEMREFILDVQAGLNYFQVDYAFKTEAGRRDMVPRVAALLARLEEK